ncbi:MAG: prepilin-type N-terminal cleavage/methylation domain-containing protein [Candidatus Omnitrophica bacterium]|nr:prepilin-type N-terminal cleavage/methylation domain-containing protein [Candidatus Omnitrophota bacterium]
MIICKEKYFINKRGGFTIPEVLCASVILLFVLMAVFSTYLMLAQYVTDTTAQAGLQGKARVVVDRIARDIRLASGISCPSAGTSITLTFDPAKIGQTGSSWNTRYRLVSDEILYSSDGTDDSEISILDSVSINTGDVLFLYDDTKETVTIDVRTENTPLSGTMQSTRFTTVVQLRNAS